MEMCTGPTSFIISLVPVSVLYAVPCKMFRLLWHEMVQEFASDLHLEMICKNLEQLGQTCHLLSQGQKVAWDLQDSSGLAAGLSERNPWGICI